MASSSEPVDEPEGDEAEAAAERLMESVQRAFAAAKRSGVPAATRLMKELRQVCAGGSATGAEIELVKDSLQVWEVKLFDWAFDDSSPLTRDLLELSEEAGDLVPLVLRVHFPDDFPFAPPLVYVASPVLSCDKVFDGALCMEMLVDWQPTYGNVETMLVQITAFLSHENARVASCVKGGAKDGGGEGVDAGSGGEVTQDKARTAYESLKAFHAKKGWSNAQ